jgi:xylulokinase
VASLGATERVRAPLFLPYLSGDRTPHNDPEAQGVLFGLTHDHDAAAIGYAVMEGVSFSLLDGWRSLAPERSAVSAMSLIGGGARSALWAQLLASLLGVAMRVHEHGAAGGALGAARLAWLADDGEEDAVCRVPDVSHEFVSDPAEASLLLPRHDRFCALYQALRDEFGLRGVAAEAPALATAG